MYHWVVLFGIRIDDFNSIDKQLKSLGLPGVSVFLGKRRHDHWMIDDEGGLNALRFNVVTDQGIENSRECDGF